MKKILYGVCGIGMGHTYRQLPIIEHFAKSAKMVLFTYGESEAFYREAFKGQKNITILQTSVPFIVGDKNGLNFEATMHAPENQGKDFFKINIEAMHRAEEIIGRPNLVVSDYEPISAQYAYAHATPLITIDQQSKYMIGDFPEVLEGQKYKDEVMRLNLFFPKAAERIACSFFTMPQKENQEQVTIVPPILRDAILNLSRKPSKEKEIIVYISSQRAFEQSFEEIIEMCSELDATFHVFGRGAGETKPTPSVKVYESGDAKSMELLRACRGIVTTAGHSLLSEAMFLGIPALALPLANYEQQMNARVIAEGGFGISSKKLTVGVLKEFIKGIPSFEKAIKEDKKWLMRGDGKQKVSKILKKALDA